MKELEMRYDCDKYDWILYKNKAIFKNYEEYRLEQKNIQPTNIMSFYGVKGKYIICNNNLYTDMLYEL
jgi:hypothetical protein